MDDLLDLVGRQLGPGAVEQLSRQLGAAPDATAKGIETSLPLLIGGLARNTRSTEGAESLSRALERDHRADLIDNLGSLLGGGGQGGGGGLGALLGGGGGDGGGGLGSLLGAAGALFGGERGGGAQQPKALDGAGILKHILGSKQSPVEEGVGRASGLDKGQVAQLLMMLAPIVMSALAKAKQGKNLDGGGLSDLLGQQRSRIEQRTPQMKGSLLDLLDRDGDGSIADDIASWGAKLGGRLLRGS
ncbi:MAG TPA: DUF937 domain-containing protein [Thermoanaerobaculia bacterium]|nr:DUF937 domain-containing protein [Thermoanaerobaculia bacterium]